LINDVLDFSKIEAGKISLEQGTFSLDSVLRELSVVLTANFGHKDIEISFDIDPKLPRLLIGDALRLQQVLLNLCGNACKFTSQGDVVLSLNQKGIVPDKVEIEFVVRDTGIGIAPEHQEIIFNEFSQAEASTTRRFGGTGLGLAISKRIVNLMGSDIELESTLGIGSNFSFLLTFQVPSDESLQLIDSLPVDQTPINSSNFPAPKRVLLIEDSRIVGHLIQKSIQNLGWAVDLAGGGRQALEMIRSAVALDSSQFPYPLIYTNCHMPAMDGWEITHQIRQMVDELKISQPIIVMVSGQGREFLSSRSEHDQNLIDGFVSKPTTASMLLEAYLEAKSHNFDIQRFANGRNRQRQIEGMRVLVVEDNPINQQIAQELLTSQGAIVSIADNGELGVQAVMTAEPQFDAVLMDIQMPVLDGYGATRLIRREPKLKSLPIIAMTANTMPSDRDACLAAGMDEHIGKPFDIAKLVLLLIQKTGFALSASEVIPNLSEEALADAPIEIPGIDLSAALGRMGGMRQLYVRTARDFIKCLDTIALDVRSTIEAGDDKKTVILLHTLKGTAATLGADALARESANLEVLCKTSAESELCFSRLSQLAEHADTTKSLLTRAIEVLSEDTTKKLVPIENIPVVLDYEAASRALTDLLMLAKAADLTVLNRFAEVQADLAGLPVEQFNALEFALQGLDLEAAIQACENSIDRLKLKSDS
jgi:CheY-like chemotaxis protein